MACTVYCEMNMDLVNLTRVFWSLKAGMPCTDYPFKVLCLPVSCVKTQEDRLMRLTVRLTTKAKRKTAAKSCWQATRHYSCSVSFSSRATVPLSQ